jgi:hypothetical protein
MKKILSLALAILVFAPSFAHAATTSNAVSVNASVQSALALDTVIIQHEGTTDSNVASMNFGQLTPTGFGGLQSTRFFTVYLTARTQQNAYVVSQTGQSLTNGTTTLPAGAQRVTPIYVAADNGGAAMPVGAALGTAGTWVATNKTLYDSENTNAAERTIQAIYGLQADPALGAGNFVPANQPAGNYTGTITFTATT